MTRNPSHADLDRVVRWSLGAVLLASLACGPLAAQGTGFARVNATVQPKMIKIYGAGGFQGLEPYQSGFLVSDQGHILTVMSYVLDTDYITAVTHDGRRYQAQLLGADPRLEIAVLKIEAEGLPCFHLDAAVALEPGARVLAFSNLFRIATGDEPTSVMHGVISAKTRLDARRGAFKSVYAGPVYALDVITNNPGAAGGVLTDRRGELVGLLGKEMRNALNNTWLNYAIPASELVDAVEDIKAGKVRPRTEQEEANRPDRPHTAANLGLVLVPNLLPKTPPFVERVRDGSPAQAAGLRADDLILFVDNRLVDSCSALADELSYIDRIDEVRLLVRRRQELLEIIIKGQD